ncbi:hypothetical protein BC828DRAFT_402805 [Blastocladiella britannica]|nr:hypothetical protein BC828DRAFT_402805 [Blastocladiella britannica]
MKSRATLLLQRDLYNIERAKLPGVSVRLVDSNLHSWRVLLCGLHPSPWTSAQLLLSIRFPESYDSDPPMVAFETIPFHPNVADATGRLSYALLDYWVPGTDMTTFLVAIQQLLCEPMLVDSCPANRDAARMARYDPDSYRQLVKDMATATHEVLARMAESAYTQPAPMHLLPQTAGDGQPSSSSMVVVATTTTTGVQQTPVATAAAATVRPRVRKVPFTEYLASWHQLATTVSGTAARVRLVSSPSTAHRGGSATKAVAAPVGADSPWSSNEQPPARTQYVGLPTGRTVRAVLPGARDPRDTLVATHARWAQQGGMAFCVDRREAERIVKLDHALRYGPNPPHSAPTLPDAVLGPGAKKVWLVPDLNASSSSTAHHPLQQQQQQQQQLQQQTRDAGAVLLELVGQPPPPLAAHSTAALLVPSGNSSNTPHSGPSRQQQQQQQHRGNHRRTSGMRSSNGQLISALASRSARNSGSGSGSGSGHHAHPPSASPSHVSEMRSALESAGTDHRGDSAGGIDHESEMGGDYDDSRTDATYSPLQPGFMSAPGSPTTKSLGGRLSRTAGKSSSYSSVSSSGSPERRDDIDNSMDEDEDEAEDLMQWAQGLDAAAPTVAIG